MRIYGNREIKTLPGIDTRPTTSKVREALFNIWRDKIESASWLDLCAGNGTMGAEALCREAKEVVAIEKSSLACKIIRENWQKVSQSPQQFKILKGDVLLRLKNLAGQQFDLIYFDPPYHQNLYHSVLEAIVKYELLESNRGQLAVEYDPQKSRLNKDNYGNLQLIQTKNYGKTALNFYQINPLIEA
jgi:16S rRNA (guanine(966)-N(2))-methyltransferase RsmD